MTITAQLKEKFLKHIDSFSKYKILVIGDIGLDEYIIGQVRRISPEAPVPVIEVESEDKRLGLAANVALNVNTLGAEAYLVSVVGEDAGAEMLKKLCKNLNVNTQDLVSDVQRPTTRKTRMMSGPHHIVRVDHEVRKYISVSIEEQILKKVEGLIDSVNVVVLEDYAKGVVTKSMVQKLGQMCKQHGKKLLVDPHRDNSAEYYHGVDLIKPNYDESLALAGLKYEDFKDNPNKINEVGQILKQKTGAKEVVLTRGKDGMSIFDSSGVLEVPTYAKKVFDVTGAGDTVIAALAVSLASGLNLQESCILANHAAGVVVGKVGCVPCQTSELVEALFE